MPRSSRKPAAFTFILQFANAPRTGLSTPLIPAQASDLMVEFLEANIPFTIAH